jgi:uncharacterized metal-binding protein YceD (DUF177 family)
VNATFDLRFLPATEMADENEREVQDEDLDTSYYRDDTIDLNELLREQFYLALPMKPLCRDDCKGSVPAVWDQLEYRHVHMHDRVGGSPARRLKGLVKGES